MTLGQAAAAGTPKYSAPTPPRILIFLRVYIFSWCILSFLRYFVFYLDCGAGGVV